jgi:hypothetical protein
MHRFLFCLVVALTGCASPKQPVTWKPTPSRQTVLYFSYGGAFSPQTRYVADGVRACREIGEPYQRRDGVTNYLIKRQVVIIPSSERWRAFWRTMHHLDVAHWKSRYSPEEVGETISDGTHWWLSTSALHGTSRSNGDNAFPTIGHPQQTTTDAAAFDALQNAFEALFDTQSA